MANPYAQGAAIAAPFAALGQQMFQGANMREAGFQKQALTQAQRGAFEGHANLYNEQANLTREKALAEQQRRSYQTPEFANGIAASFAGLSGQQGNEIADYQRNGNWGMNAGHDLPADQEGPTMPAMPKAAPSWFRPEVERQFNMGRGAFLANLGGTGDTNANQMADAYAKILEQGRVNQAISDPAFRRNLAPTMAAIAGKGEFNNLGNAGVFNQFDGSQKLNDIGVSDAQKNRAQAGNASASAAVHRAQIPEVQARTELTRSKIGAPVTNLDGSVTTPAGKPIKLSATAEKELFEADDNIKSGNSTIGLLKQALELNDKAYSGYFAKGRAVVRSNLPGDSEAADATVNLDNIMTSQALESLKSTFGGAPTEGERKILLDIQASADKTPKQREELIKRAIQASEQRLVFNTNKAKSLRSGTYNSVDPQQSAGGGHGWSIKEVK